MPNIFWYFFKVLLITARWGNFSGFKSLVLKWSTFRKIKNLKFCISRYFYFPRSFLIFGGSGSPGGSACTPISNWVWSGYIDAAFLLLSLHPPSRRYHLHWQCRHGMLVTGSSLPIIRIVVFRYLINYWLVM